MTLGRRQVFAPLKQACVMNPESLPESTPAGFEFDYIDIGNVEMAAGIVGTERLTFGVAPSRARRIVRPGDVIVSTVRTYLRAIAAIDEGHGGAIASTGFAVLRARPGVDQRFLAQVLKSEDFVRQVIVASVGVGYPAINPSTLAAIKIPLPPLEEQRAIAAFLDAETARVDALIEKKESLIALLYERERAMIDPLVLRGSSPVTECAPIGPEWRRDVPPGWKRHRIRHMFRPEKRQNYVDLTVLSVFREFGVVEKESQTGNNNKTPEDLSLYQLVEPRDLVINKMKGWQGSLGISGYKGITSPDYVVMVPTHDADDAFLHHLLRSPSMIHAYRIISTGVRPAQWRVDVMRFLDLNIWLPSKEQQISIVSRISGGFATARKIMDKTRISADHLREYRSALITAAVNGQIDPEAWRRRGDTDWHLDRIEADMTTEAAE